jgi:hypothetical protein
MEENIQKNLVSLLKLFKNRPYHLSKYLLDNNALSGEFLDKIKKSDKLSDISDIKTNFNDINKMEDFYDSLLESGDSNTVSDLTISELSIDLNKKLKSLIMNEKYEEAAALRDFMMSKNIKKND